LALKALAEKIEIDLRCTHHIFIECLQHLSEMDRYAHIIITSKHLTGCEALLRCPSYRFIVKWIALLNSCMSCKADSCGVSLIME